MGGDREGACAGKRVAGAGGWQPFPAGWPGGGLGWPAAGALTTPCRIIVPAAALLSDAPPAPAQPRAGNVW